jgi:hypothetical protein
MRFKIITLSLLLAASVSAYGQNTGGQGSEKPKRAPLPQAGIKFDEEAFIKAVVEGDEAQVKSFLSAGISPDTKDKEGATALFHAILKGRKKIALDLIASGADVNLKVESDSPLRVASGCGSFEIADALLQKGAEVEAKDRGGHTTLLIAMFGTALRNAPEALSRQFITSDKMKDCMDTGDGHEKIVRLLVKRGADVNVRATDGGETPLFIAALFGNTEMVKLLLEHHVDVNAKTWQDRTALVSVESLRYLPNDPEFRNNQPMMDWLRSTLGKHAEITRMLRQAGGR